MAKRTTTSKPAATRAATISRIFDIAREGMANDLWIISQIKGSVPEALKDHRAAFIAGRVVAELFSRVNDPDAAKASAMALVELPNSKAKAAKRRTKAQDDVVNAARMAWSRLLAKAGIVSPNAGAGNRNQKRKAQKPALIVEAPKAPVIPTIANEDDWRGELLAEIERLEALLKKNAGNMPLWQRKPFADFVKAGREALKAGKPEAKPLASKPKAEA